MKCSYCKQYTPPHAFAIFRTRNGEIRRRGICKGCRGKYAKENFRQLQVWRKNYNVKNRSAKRLRDLDRRLAGKKLVDDIKANTPCADCGIKFPSVAMDFDHLKGKNRNVSSLVSGAYSPKIILEEIKLCEIVCACCHRIRTASRKENLSRAKSKLLIIG